MKSRRWLGTVPLRLKTLFLKRHVEDELDEEFQFHLERKVEELVERGASVEEARVMAKKALGVERQKEQCRDVRAGQWVERLRADVVFGWRQLRKRKVTTAAAVLSLGLAIGACTTAFRLVDALFLRAMPVSDPASLYVVSYKGFNSKTGEPTTWESNSYPMFQHMAEVLKGKADLAAVSMMSHLDVTYGSDAEMEKVYRQRVSGDVFKDFGLKPALGRLLTAEDDREPGKSPYAVISYDYWTRRFGQDPKVIGRTFRMDNLVYEIVGVAPKGFTGTEPGTMTDLFAPTKMEPGFDGKNAFWLRIFVRAKPDVNLRTLQSEMDSIFQAWEKDRAKTFLNFPKYLLDKFPNATLVLKPAGTGASSMQTDYGSALVALSVLVGMVLLIACANVANLMSAQAAARAREMALRVSIGAGRWRLVQMVLLESGMLGLMAAGVGLAFTWWAAPLVVSRINPPDNPARLALPADWVVVGFGLVLTVLVTLLFGLIPALRASSVRPANALKGGEEPHAKRRLMHGLIAAQVAFCFVVLFLAGLFAATFSKLTRQPVGFVAERMLLLDMVTKEAQAPVKWDQMAAALRSVPEVQATALEDWPLMSGTMHNDRISVHGGAPSETLTFFLAVSPGWLQTMRIPMIGGRDFREGDTSPSVAVVNETFAKTYFHGANPVGNSFETKGPDGVNKHYEIVGLVRDVAYRDLRETMLPQAYLPIHRAATAVVAKPGVQVTVPTAMAATALEPMRDVTIAVRTTSDDPMLLAETLRRKVTEIDPEFHVSTVTTQEGLISAQTIRERLLASLGLFFAGVALLIAAIGLYGVLNYSVLQRERELGVRLAMGAPVANIARLVTTRVFAMVVVGAGAGLVLGMGSVRYIEALLFGVKGSDLTMLALPMVVLLLVALVAAVPAVVRAARIDPAIMLRAE